MPFKAVTQKIIAADVQASVSGLLASITWLTPLAEWLQIVATIVAIVAGGAAAWYHFERARESRRQRTVREADAARRRNRVRREKRNVV